MIENENISPLADVPVIKRDISATSSFNPLEDDYPEDDGTDDEQPQEPTKAKENKKSSPKEFVVDEITETEEVDDFFDVEHGTDSEREEAKKLNRKIVAKSILDMVGSGLPMVVKSVAGLPEKEIKIMILEAERMQSPFKTIFEKAIQNEKESFEKLDQTIKYFTVQMEEPLRQVMRNKSIDISPEAQLVFWGIGLVGSVGYATYDIRQQNIKIMEELQKVRDEMNKQPIKTETSEAKS